MSIINASPLLGAGADGYQIERSLRFNSADSAYLNRTPASTTETTAWTYSAWVKRGAAGNKTFFGAFYGFNGRYFLLGFSSSDQLQAYGGNYSVNINPGVNVELATTAVYRDFSAWMHVVFTYDSANATASDRARFYVNGLRVTAFATATYPGLSSSTYINYSTTPHYIGDPNNGAYFDGYLTEVNFVSGQALTPSSFGETDTITGAWKPKRYAGTYGTNGFYLKFADNSGTTSTTLGKDSSGNGNNWTPNNFSVTAGAGNDSLIDTPTPYADGGNGRGNYATWNPLKKNSGVSFPNGNLDFSGPATAYPVFGNIAMTTGKWYWENLVNSNDAGDYPQFGVVDLSADENNSSNLGAFRAIAYRRSGFIRKEGTDILSGRPTFTNGDVISVAFDASTGKVWFAKNGTWVNGASGSAGDPAAGTNEVGTVSTAIQGYVAGGGGYSSATFSVNFGQRPFAYTPPSGFKALNTQNLPEPSIKKPSSYMDVLTWTGNATYPRAITGLNFSPDLIWLKSRSNAYDNLLMDAVRGTGNTKWLSSNLTDAEGTNFNNANVSSLDSSGFTIGTTGGTNILNASGVTNVAWCWDESATPGFDIVTYTGTGVARTIAHSLGVAPSMMIVKRRTTAGGDWDVYHSATGATKRLFLNTTAASQTTSVAWNDTAPTSSVFTVGTGADVNQNGDTHVAYLWSEVAGMSKFGSYTGNGSADGPFVYCGFRPRWILIKSSSNVTSWYILDAARNDSNTVSRFLYPDLSSAEVDGGAGVYVDFVANGFKWRSGQAAFNASGVTYIFAAFAETAFRYSLAR